MEEKFDLPIASIARIIRNALPKHYQVGKDARLAMAKATSVWVLYCATVANTISSSRKRKTISGDDVLAALAEMDFDDFVGPLKEMRSELMISARKKAKLSRQLAKTGASGDPNHLEVAGRKPDMDDETEDEQIVDHQETKHEDGEDPERESREDAESHEEQGHFDSADEDNSPDETEMDDDDQQDSRPMIDSSTVAML